jgi:hypothetical protein
MTALRPWSTNFKSSQVTTSVLHLEEVPVVIYKPVFGSGLSRAIVEVSDNGNGAHWRKYVPLNNTIVEQPIGDVGDDEADFAYTLHSDQPLIGT